MRVVEIARLRGPKVLEVATRPRPEPQAGQVVIRVAWAGVKRSDALQRAGAYDPPRGASDLPGLEASGEIVATGKGSDWSVGERVLALLSGAEARLTFSEIKVRRLTVMGSTLRPQSVRAMAVIAEELRSEICPLLEAGKVLPVMDRSFPLTYARDAHAWMEASEHIGKIVLEVAGG